MSETTAQEVIGQSTTHEDPLSEVLERISRSPSIDGVALFGSRPIGLVEEHSDHDILILTTGDTNVLHVFTSIERRLADVSVLDAPSLDAAIKKGPPVSSYSAVGEYVKMLEDGVIVFDRSGRLARARAVLANRKEASTLPPEIERYNIWYWSNLHLAQLTRVLRGAGDDVTFDVMLSFHVGRVCRVHLTARQRRWDGDKRALRELAHTDPEFLSKLRLIFEAGNRHSRLDAYRRCLDHALAPLGGVWEERVTAILPRGGAPWDAGKNGLEWWSRLVSPGDRHDPAA